MGGNGGDVKSLSRWVGGSGEGGCGWEWAGGHAVGAERGWRGGPFRPPTNTPHTHPPTLSHCSMIQSCTPPLTQTRLHTHPPTLSHCSMIQSLGRKLRCATRYTCLPAKGWVGGWCVCVCVGGWVGCVCVGGEASLGGCVVGGWCVCGGGEASLGGCVVGGWCVCVGGGGGVTRWVRGGWYARYTRLPDRGGGAGGRGGESVGAGWMAGREGQAGRQARGRGQGQGGGARALTCCVKPVPASIMMAHSSPQAHTEEM